MESDKDALSSNWCPSHPVTVGVLKEIFASRNVPDDAVIWLQQPDEYIEDAEVQRFEDDDADAEYIECLNLGYWPEKKRFFLYHHW